MKEGKGDFTLTDRLFFEFPVATTVAMVGYGLLKLLLKPKPLRPFVVTDVGSDN